MKSEAIDLPGHGERRKLSWLVSWRQYIEAVRYAAATFDTPPIVVGHSMGGGVIAGAAELAPGLFRALVYVSAFVPLHGESIAALAKTEPPNPNVRFRLSRGEVYFEPQDAASLFFHDCSQPEQWAALVQPQPIRPVGTAIRLSADRYGAIPRHYICCDNDRALSPAFQQRMIERTPMQSVSHMDCGHSPFLADPEGLADLLAGIRDGASPPVEPAG